MSDRILSFEIVDGDGTTTAVAHVAVSKHRPPSDPSPFPHFHLFRRSPQP